MMPRRKQIINIASSVFFACFFTLQAVAQRPVKIGKALEEHIFTFGELDVFEDHTSRLTFSELLKKGTDGAFKPNVSYYPGNTNHASAYWYRVRLQFSGNGAGMPELFEFYDQTTDDITAYMPGATGKYTVIRTGADGGFDKRLFRHKNFEFMLPQRHAGTYYYYFRVKSGSDVNVIIVYRTVKHFINYALVEYISFGLFYGMILVFCLYNLLMFFATQLRQYLYYMLYMLSVGLYEMSVDGVAFQFLWSDAPRWNEFAYGIALYSMTLFALLFTQRLLQLKKHSQTLHRLISVTIVLRTIYFFVCLFFRQQWFIYKFWELIPLSVAFISGVVIWKRGFEPARFFVIGYFFLFVGAIMKLITVLGFATSLPGAAGHYSMTVGLMLEMILLSFAITDQVRLLRREKEMLKDEAMLQMKLNAELQNSINQKLEREVAQRTRQLVIKSDQIEAQAREIYRMNKLLENDNIHLRTDIEKLTDARIDSPEISFDEFSRKYPAGTIVIAF